MLAGDGIAMSKLLEGMVEHGIWHNAPNTYSFLSEALKDKFSEDMRSAILWLAENVTDEMVDAADYELSSDDSFVTKEVIAAALRKAAGK